MITHFMIHLHLPNVKECQYVTVDERGITLTECILLAEAVPLEGVHAVSNYVVQTYQPELVTAIGFDAPSLLTPAQRELLRL